MQGWRTRGITLWYLTFEVPRGRMVKRGKDVRSMSAAGTDEKFTLMDFHRTWQDWVWEGERSDCHLTLCEFNSNSSTCKQHKTAQNTYKIDISIAYPALLICISHYNLAPQTCRLQHTHGNTSTSKAFIYQWCEFPVWNSPHLLVSFHPEVLEPAMIRDLKLSFHWKSCHSLWNLQD